MRVLFLILVVSAQACSFRFETCITDDDCPNGSECVLSQSDYVCLFPETTPLGDIGERDMVTQSDLDPINNRNNQNNSNNPNNPNNQNNSNNTVNNLNNPKDMGPDVEPTFECIVPLPQTMCRNDTFEPNNGPADAELLPETSGCRFQDFESKTYSIDATLCALESEDWFSFGFFPCTLRKKLIVHLVPKRDCTGDEYTIEIPNFPCDRDDRVLCERLENGERRTTVLLDREGDIGSEFNSMKIGIVDTTDSAEFEYNLSIRITD